MNRIASSSEYGMKDRAMAVAASLAIQAMKDYRTLINSMSEEKALEIMAKREMVGAGRDGEKPFKEHILTRHAEKSSDVKIADKPQPPKTQIEDDFDAYMQRSRNKRMHAANGNTASETSSAE